MILEIYKDIKGFEGLYQVSNKGNIKSLSRYRGGNSSRYFISERILKNKINNHGRPCINVSKDGIITTLIIHQIEAIAFLNHIPDGHNIIVDHIDNNPLNNNLENLQLITSRENITKDMKKGSSVFTGVFLNKKNNKWRSVIVINKIKKHLGYFTEEIEAYIAYENERLSLN